MQTQELQLQPVRRRKHSPIWLIAALILALFFSVMLFFFGRAEWNLARYGVRTVRSSVDYDHDLIEDYRDMMLGAKAYVRTKPVYDSGYVSGGYPERGRGVCTDVIWRAFRAAGYDLKAMIDEDIAKNPSLYPLPGGLIDPDIDFRRVVNLKVFFERHALSLTTDAAQIDQWQPGDLVFYPGHVAMVSDRRNAEGVPFIIHHTGHGAFEEDKLTYQPITAHFRWPG